MAVAEESRLRKRNLMLRLSDSERMLLEALAEAMGLSMADALRQALRIEAKRRRIEPTKKLRKAKGRP